MCTGQTMCYDFQIQFECLSGSLEDSFSRMLKTLDMEKQNKREEINLVSLKLYVQSLFRIQSHLYLFPSPFYYPFDAVDLIACFFMHCTIENAALNQSPRDEAKMY